MPVKGTGVEREIGITVLTMTVLTIAVLTITVLTIIIKKFVKKSDLISVIIVELFFS